MNKTLEQLAEMRGHLYQQMISLGDFRPGTISVNFRKCGRKNCACAQPDHPGHGPQYLWNTTQSGKSRSQNLRLGPELEKVRLEVERYKEFRRLCQEAIKINEGICHKRSIPEIEDASELEALKKKLRRKFIKRRRKRSIS